MPLPIQNHFLIVGAGAAGLMAARELARAGNRVTIIEARDRCGGRIWPLPMDEFGYEAEGGAEFVHGEAPVTRALMREAGLSLLPNSGTHWSNRSNTLTQDDRESPHMGQFHKMLAALKTDMPIAAFLQINFAAAKYAALRQSILGMVEGYDAADPARASTFALRDEWMSEGVEQQGRIAEGYGALLAFLEAECRRQGASIQLRTEMVAIDADAGRVTARCRDGATIEADAVILTLPLPVLTGIELPPATHKLLAASAADIGFGNVVKILLRFKTKFWVDHGGLDLADLSFLFSNAKIPTWWTQHPADHAVLTGWFAGPKAETVAHLTHDELIDMGIVSLAQIFDRPVDRLKAELVAARAINWGIDPFARGAYSYATPQTRAAQTALQNPDGSGIFFSGEALYEGRDMGTVEAALASGQETARTILSASQS